jgi:predicted nucleic acid-binding protein
MKTGYIDTSFLLAIIFEDANYYEAVETWNRIESKYSSILLEIESRINLFKYFVKKKHDESAYIEKQTELVHLLRSINLKIIDNEINLEIMNNDKLKKARSLDSIHLATANIINKLDDNTLLLCSYDKEMREVGKDLGMNIPG